MMLPASPSDLGLPHRDPFVFVDRVTGLDPGRSAEGEKVFPAEDPVFRGHFPGRPIVPGVLLVEALAQTAGIAGATEGVSVRFLLSAVRSMKFPLAALPGQVIRLAARRTAVMDTLWMFEVRAETEAGVVAEGHVVLNAAE